MSGINTVSVSNLANLDRYQDDLHRAPVVNQVQNSELIKVEYSKKIIKPNEPEHVQNKIVDANDKKRQGVPKRKRNRPNLVTVKGNNTLKANRDEGFFVDVSA